ARRKPAGCGDPLSRRARRAHPQRAADQPRYHALHHHGPARLRRDRDAVPGSLRELRHVRARGPVFRRRHGDVLRRLVVLPPGDLRCDGEPADRSPLVHQHHDRARTFRHGSDPSARRAPPRLHRLGARLQPAGCAAPEARARDGGAPLSSPGPRQLSRRSHDESRPHGGRRAPLLGALRRAPVTRLDSPARRRVPHARVPEPRPDPHRDDRTRMAVSSRQLKTAGAVAGSLVGLWLLLSIPGAEPPVAPAPERGRGFAWNQDTLWRSLETTYVHTRVAGCGTADRAAAGGLSGLAATAEQLLRAPVPSGAAALDSVERRFFALAPLVAACPHHLRDYVRLSGRLREAIKWQSRRWDVASDGARARLYRSLYGFRGAVEEAMLQHPDSSLPLVEGRREPSATPATNVHG